MKNPLSRQVDVINDLIEISSSSSDQLGGEDDAYGEVNNNDTIVKDRKENNVVETVSSRKKSVTR